MNKWRLVGTVFQAIVLGSLFFIALARLLMVTQGTSVFKYQGY